MGCFSYICPKCKKHIFSDKYGNCVGEEVHLALLDEGVVVEEMHGRYNSYGNVHVGNGSYHGLNNKPVPQPTLDSNKQEGCHIWQYKDWSDIVDMCFEGNDHSGIVAIHKDCFDGTFPDTQSKNDPDQGWESDEEEDEEDSEDEE